MTRLNLHLYPSPCRFESRMMRITGSLAKADYFDRIDLVGIWEPGLAETEEIDDRRRIVRINLSTPSRRLGGAGRLLRLLEWNLAIRRRYRDERVRCVNPHTVWALPAANWLAARHKAVNFYDTHELETETHASRGLRQAVSRFIERRYISDVDAIGVVSCGIEDWYHEHYGHQEIHTLKNYPLSGAQPGQSRQLKDAFGLSDNDVLFIYQGHLSRGGVITTLLEAFSRAPADRHLVFMGFGPFAEDLQAIAERTPTIHFQPAVPFQDVPIYTGSADVAIVLFSDTCLSYRHVLPNKLLESLNAGVPVVFSDLPDMRNEVLPYGAGWAVGPSVDDLVDLVTSLDHAEIKQRKKGAMRWSRDKSWDDIESLIHGIYDRLLAPEDSRS